MDLIVNLLKPHFPYYVEAVQNMGWTSTFFSLRDVLLEKMIVDYIPMRWNWPNYIFGGAEFYAIRSEMDIPDVFFLTGIIGLLSMGYFYVKFIFKKLLASSFTIYFIAILLLYMSISSGILFSADNALPLLLFTLYFHFETRNDGSTLSRKL